MKTQLLQTFQQFRIIHCLCPKCNSISRLSDFHVYSSERCQRTWLDSYETKLTKIENKELKFEEVEKTLRELAHKRGQNQVPRLIRKAMNEKFSKRKIDPYDIKPILHPIEFVLFNGMHKENLKNIVLMAQKSSSINMTRLQKQILDSIKENRYDWNVVRVSNDGNVEYENN